MSDSKTLSDYVAGEIRARLARERITGRDLAGKLGVSRSWISYRLTGTTEISLNDLEAIAAALDVGVTELLPQQARQGPSSISSSTTLTKRALSRTVRTIVPSPARRLTGRVPPQPDSHTAARRHAAQSDIATQKDSPRATRLPA